MAKRSATTQLNHENWDQEEEPEDAGVFQKASTDVLATRVIRTAKRRVNLSDNDPDAKRSPFSGFTGFSSSSKAGQTDSKPSPFSNFPGFKSSNSTSNSEQAKDTSFFSLQKNNSTEPTFKPLEHIFKPVQPTNGEDDSKSKNLQLLKDLNLSCSSWISEHLEKNPYCILTPIFKDYEKHLAQIDLDTESNTKELKTGSETTTSNSTTETAKTVNFGSDVSEEPEKDKETEKEKPEFKFGGVQPMKPLNPPFGSGISLGSSPFSLNQIAAKPTETEKESESKKDEEETEEPPKNDFVPVVEEDSIYDIKCKVFTKKEGNFVSRGVGTLFLKPVKDSTKTQLVVRAHTNLGNILLNVLLTPGMPIQKTGKNNAMIVCIPTPESKPPPVPVLIRVKTSDECDTLIKKLEECRGS